MSNVPEGAQLSDDGQWWWDDANQQWNQVEGAGGAGGAAGAPGGEGGAGPAGAGGGDAGEVTAEDLEPVNDTGIEPGDVTNLTDQQKEFFIPDYEGAADDESGADVDAAVDADSFTGESEGEQTEEES